MAGVSRGIKFFHGLIGEIYGSGGLDWKSGGKILFKTAWGVQEGLVSAWAINVIRNVVTIAMDGYKKAMLMGAGFGAEGIIDAALYSCLLVLLIDAIDIFAGEALVDILFEGGEKSKRWFGGG